MLLVDSYFILCRHVRNSEGPLQCAQVSFALHGENVERISIKNWQYSVDLLHPSQSAAATWRIGVSVDQGWLFVSLVLKSGCWTQKRLWRSSDWRTSPQSPSFSTQEARSRRFRPNCCESGWWRTTDRGRSPAIRRWLQHNHPWLHEDRGRHRSYPTERGSRQKLWGSMAGQAGAMAEVSEAKIIIY